MNPKVLIVDKDNNFIKQAEKYFKEEFKIDLDTVCCIKDALIKIQNNHFEYILLDISIPYTLKNDNNSDKLNIDRNINDLPLLNVLCEINKKSKKTKIVLSIPNEESQKALVLFDKIKQKRNKNFPGTVIELILKTVDTAWIFRDKIRSEFYNIPKVLIVDDYPYYFEEIMEIVKFRIDSDIIVHICECKKDALQRISELTYEIIFVDLNLPSTSGGNVKDGLGYTLIQDIVKKSKTSTIMLITAENEQIIQDKYLNKPDTIFINEYIIKGEGEKNDIAGIIISKINTFIKLRKNIQRDKTNLFLTVYFDKIINNYFSKKNSIKGTIISTYDIPSNAEKLVKEANKQCEEQLVCGIIVAVQPKDKKAMEFINQFHELRQDIPIVAITKDITLAGFYTLNEAIKQGAHGAARLLDDPSIVLKAIENASAQREKNLNQMVSFIGSHAKTAKVIGTAIAASKGDASVLITGESGTGKEVIANAIHEHSNRTGKFVDLNCSAMPETLIEAILFGTEKGIASGIRENQGLFEIAEKGTLFLDEITEMQIETQAKLLRVLETKNIRKIGGTGNIPIDVKVIAATNRSLREAVKQNKLREDLFERLNVFHIYLPPIRERASDIPKLVYFFIDTLSKEHDKGIIGIEADAMDLLEKEKWPGNVRELKNVIRRIIITSPYSKDLITKIDIEEALKQNMLDDTIEKVHPVNDCFPVQQVIPIVPELSKKNLGDIEIEIEMLLKLIILLSYECDKTMAHVTFRSLVKQGGIVESENTFTDKLKKEFSSQFIGYELRKIWNVFHIENSDNIDSLKSYIKKISNTIKVLNNNKNIDSYMYRLFLPHNVSKEGNSVIIENKMDVKKFADVLEFDINNDSWKAKEAIHYVQTKNFERMFKPWICERIEMLNRHLKTQSPMNKFSTYFLQKNNST